MRDADSMADTGLPVPRRPAGVVSGGRRGRAGQCGGSFGPLCPFRGPLPVPFLVASSAPLALGFGELAAPWLAGLMEPLFRVPGAGSCCAGAGAGGGLPHRRQDGKADLYRENLVSREEAERSLAFCNNSNPVFLISVLGVGVFGSVRAGVWLWLIHVLPPF